MENITAVLIPNTGAENLTENNFYELQQEVHNPMVIFLKKGTNEVIKHFRIAANTMEQLTDMFKYKYFDTPDLPEEQYVTFAGGYFIGCGPKNAVKKKKDLTAATV
ncbi:hypothetical protein V7182_23935 [Neobacillus drentensis]|uniref:hypothetical protein n=1 Tax=Neobacillus drentensis TaxID=220684 RepID=UPI002FFDB074